MGWESVLQIISTNIVKKWELNKFKIATEISYLLAVQFGMESAFCITTAKIICKSTAGLMRQFIRKPPGRNIQIYPRTVWTWPIRLRANSQRLTAPESGHRTNLEIFVWYISSKWCRHFSVMAHSIQLGARRRYVRHKRLPEWKYQKKERQNEKKNAPALWT